MVLSFCFLSIHLTYTYQIFFHDYLDLYGFKKNWVHLFNSKWQIHCDGRCFSNLTIWRHSDVIFGHCIIYNCSPRPNGLWVHETEGRMGYWNRAHSGKRNNCFSKIQLVGQKYRDKTTLASKTRFSRHCFGFQSRCFSLPVGYNI